MTEYTLITGATTGIGYELTMQFAKKNKNLILVARNNDQLIKIKNELEERHKIRVVCISKDLSKENSAEELIEEIKKQNLLIGVLVNNAGVGLVAEFYKSTIADSKKMIQLNIQTLTTLTHAFLPEMIKNKKGQILNVASAGGFQAGPYMAVYYATKAFVVSFSEALHEEVKEHNIFVTALCPGPVLTGFQQAAQFSEKQGPMHLSAYKVASDGIKGLDNNVAIVIPGWLTQLAIQLNRIFPRFMMRNILKKRLKQRVSLK